MKHHVTVLREEAIDGLGIEPGDTVVDATIGSLGHAKGILAHLGGSGTFVGIDQDSAAVQSAKKLEVEGANIYLVHGNFRDIDRILRQLHIEKVDGALADLGWRMEQFSGGKKGFSFEAEEPLLMTYGEPEEYPFTAEDIVNRWKEEDLQNVLKGYGEERFAGRIAKAIVRERKETAIKTARQLADIVTRAVPGFYRRGSIHPATRTFQALRIAVNDELSALEDFIEKTAAVLRSGGRMAIISFHSLEDRIVKRKFLELERGEEGRRITKRPIRPSAQELAENPSARSAKLRIFEKS